MSQKIRTRKKQNSKVYHKAAITIIVLNKSEILEEGKWKEIGNSTNTEDTTMRTSANKTIRQEKCESAKKSTDTEVKTMITIN